MRNFKIVLFVMAAILFVGLVISCQKEGNEPIASDNEVAFAINISNLKSSSMLKNAIDYNLADADKIVLTIQNSDGSATKYTDSEVKIQQMNGYYYTQKIVLKTGNYKLTSFLILNANDSTIFAAPITGSQEAQNVSSPSPIAFSVTKNISTPINVEVLSTENKKPEDFGLNHFSIIEVKTYGFMIGVAEFETDKMLSAKLTVSNGTYSFIQNLDTITNNVVTVKDSLSSYTLKIEKSGYKTYTHTYSLDSMKLFENKIGNLPLLIELEKEGELTKTLNFINWGAISKWNPEGGYSDYYTFDLRGPGADEARVLFRYDLSSIPSSAVIINVKLKVFSWYNYGIGTASIHSIIQTNWNNQASWNKYDGSNLWNNAGGDYNPIPIDQIAISSPSITYDVCNEWNITNEVQNIISSHGNKINLIMISTLRMYIYLTEEPRAIIEVTYKNSN